MAHVGRTVLSTIGTTCLFAGGDIAFLVGKAFPVLFVCLGVGVLDCVVAVVKVGEDQELADVFCATNEGTEPGVALGLLLVPALTLAKKLRSGGRPVLILVTTLSVFGSGFVTGGPSTQVVLVSISQSSETSSSPYDVNQVCRLYGIEDHQAGATPSVNWLVIARSKLVSSSTV